MTTTPPTDDLAPKRSLRQAARGSVLNLLGTAISALATFTMAVLITRMSSTVEAGLFFSATSLFLIAINIGRLGTNTGLVYFIAGSRGRGERGLAGAFMRIAARPVALVVVLTSVALVLGADQIASWLSPQGAETFALNLRIMAVAVPFAAVMNLATAAAQGMGTMKLFALVEQMLLPLLQLALLAVILTVGLSSVGPSAWAAAYAPAAVVGWLWWRRLARADQSDTAPGALRSGPFWRFTLPRALASVSQIAMQRLDIVLVGALASLPAAAVYAATTRFLVLGQMAGRAISLSVQPLLGVALARGDLRDARELYQVCAAWLVMGTWPLYFLLMNFAPQILSIFGEDYRSGTSALILLCAVMLFSTSTGAVDIVLNMAGRSLWNLVNVLIAFSVFITLDLWLIPRIGFMGAAIGWASAIAVAKLLPLLQILHAPGIHPFGRASLMTMAMSAACFGAMPWTVAALGGDTAGGLVAATAGFLLYVIFLVLARGPLQLGTLMQVVRGRGRRRPGAMKASV